ncbi:MAG: hypothetical protein SW833_24585 [Cyanobacteriota bacterium]|nr:hypothetical protein [Cyanobacteriota bacterium]
MSWTRLSEIEVEARHQGDLGEKDNLTKAPCWVMSWTRLSEIEVEARHQGDFR